MPDDDVGVTVAVCPTLMLLKVVVSTLRFTTNELLITSTCVPAELELDALLLAMAATLPLPLPFEPLEPVDVERPEPVPVPVMLVPDEPDEPSTSPTVRFTIDTVPSIGAVRFAPANACIAATTFAFAAATLA